MAGPELEMGGEVACRLDRSEEAASEGVHRADVSGRALKQVGTPNVTDEEEVARQHSHRQIADERVGDQEADVLGGVSRGVAHLKAQRADVERIFVVEPLRVEAVLPVGIAFTGHEKGRAGADREVARARDEVRVDMRLGDLLDVHLPMLGRMDEAIDVAAGIDDDRGFRFLAADEIGGLSESFVVDPFEQHRRRAGEGYTCDIT